MILDQENLFSDAQAITTSAKSTNVLDFGHAFDSGVGADVSLALRVNEAFNNLTSLAVSIETDDNEGFSSAKVIAEHTFLAAELTAGAVLDIALPKNRVEQYLRLDYAVTGTNPTTGQLTAGFVPTANSEPGGNW